MLSKPFDNRDAHRITETEQRLYLAYSRRYDKVWRTLKARILTVRHPTDSNLPLTTFYQSLLT